MWKFILRSSHVLLSLIISSSQFFFYSFISFYCTFTPLSFRSVCPLYLSNPSLSSQMRWSGPGLTISFPSNLLSTPLSPDLHTSWTGTSQWLVFPFALTQRAVPQATVPPWTHRRHRWRRRQEAHACAHRPISFRTKMLLLGSHTQTFGFVFFNLTAKKPSRFPQGLSCSHMCINPVK